MIQFDDFLEIIIVNGNLCGNEMDIVSFSGIGLLVVVMKYYRLGGVSWVCIYFFMFDKCVQFGVW